MTKDLRLRTHGQVPEGFRYAVMLTIVTRQQFTASGSIKIPGIRCANSAAGRTCKAPDFQIDGALTSQYSMEPYALQLPKPTSDSCTVNSIVLQQERFLIYAVSDLEYAYKSAYDDGATSLKFKVQVPGLDVKMDCDSSDARPDLTNDQPLSWFGCVRPTAPSQNDLQDGAASYDRASNVLSLNVTWACRDKNPSHP